MVAPKEKRRERRLGAVPLFFGMLQYALSGMRNLREALSDALAFFEAGPPKNLSKGSVSPARERMPVDVLREGWKHILAQAEQRPQRCLLGGLRVRCVDGTSFAVADTARNVKAYGRPGVRTGQAAFPRMRSVLVMEAATHLFRDEAHGPFDRVSELVLADQLLERIAEPGVLLEADRNFYSFERAVKILRLGAELLLRVKSCVRFPVLAELPDGSYLTAVYSPAVSGRAKWRARIEQHLATLGAVELLELAQAQRLELLGAEEHSALPASMVMRVIEYEIRSPDAKPIKTRLLSSVLDPAALDAKHAADGYHLRWREELGIREIKWLCDQFSVPQLPGHSDSSVEQDYIAVLLAHSVLRATMLLAADEHAQDPTRLSLSGTRAVLQRYLPRLPHLSSRQRAQWLSELLRQIARNRLPTPTNRLCPRAVKAPKSKWQRKNHHAPPSTCVDRRLVLRLTPNAGP